MTFLERAIRRGVRDAVGKAVGNAVRQAVEPTATNLINQATQSIDQATGNSQQQLQAMISNPNIPFAKIRNLTGLK